ncbi:MAG: UDP-3-O-(3-hydroxymyristoyl)glucosamine N-acyltransferase [Lachnospiraceae bacterium]|nr:UDP-3-O-(3-hydroxymyristoyl)glucosamine N-acyltransferase [Lachnospiraceae bacterium]
MYLSDVTKGIEGKLIRDGEFQTLEYCTGRLEVPFLTFMGNPRFVDKMSPYVSCVLCSAQLADMLPESIAGVFICESPKENFQVIHNRLSRDEAYCLPVTPNKIGEGCVISERASIAGNNVEIGDRVIIEDHVTIYDHVKIGNDCVIRSGAVIGGKAFTFARTGDNRILGMEDLGQVVLGDRVEVFSLAHVAKGILPTDTTYIGDDVKIDALVQIGHGSVIRERTLIAEGAVIAGNVYIGEDSWVGVNAAVSNRIRIGGHARVSLGSVVTKDVADGQTVTGNFAIEHADFIRNLKDMMHLH